MTGVLEPAGCVDPTDPAEVEQVLRAGLAAIGLAGLLGQLATVLPVRPGRPAGFLRSAQPAVVEVGQQILTVPAEGPGQLRQVVGGIVLSTEPVAAHRLPVALADLVVRYVAEGRGPDAAAVLLTALRDAATAGGRLD